MKRPLTQEDLDIIAWLDAEFVRTGFKQTALADHLGFNNRSTVTDILKGKRRVKASEIAKMRAFFASAGPVVAPQAPSKAGGVSVMGTVGGIDWSESVRAIGRQPVEGVADDRYPLEEQTAYRVDADSIDGEFRAGDFVVTAPFPNELRTKAIAGDVLLVRYVLKDTKLFRLTLKRATYCNDGLAMVPVFSDTPDVPSTERAVGILIALRRSYG